MRTANGGAPTPEIAGFDDLEAVGRGGFSTVYRARQVDLGRLVAVKVLEVVPGLDPSIVRERFDRERHTLGALSGIDGIVEVHLTTYTADGRPAIVMELMQRSLSARVREEGALEVSEVAAVGERLARSLAAAHERGVFHRDVTPANVLIDDRGRVALADFGIAALHRGDGSGEAGSPEHAAPELLRGDGDVDLVRADVYSLGSTLHHLVTGRPPFGSRRDPGGLDGLVARVLAGGPAPIDRPEAHPHLDAVLTQALAADPAARFPHATAFAEALAEAAAATHYRAPMPTGRDGHAPHGAVDTPGGAGARSGSGSIDLVDDRPTVEPSPPLPAAPPSEPPVPADDLPTVPRPRGRPVEGRVVEALAADDARRRQRTRRRVIAAVVAAAVLGGAAVGWALGGPGDGAGVTSVRSD